MHGNTPKLNVPIHALASATTGSPPRATGSGATGLRMVQEPPGSQYTRIQPDSLESQEDTGSGWFDHRRPMGRI